MALSWEQKFGAWAKPPGQAEEDRCENAVSAIRNAIKRSTTLQSRNVTTFVQGSYRNHTNVRSDSDVDIGVLCHNTFFFDLPDGTTRETFGIQPASYHYAEFKDDVEEALVNHFGRSAVTRGRKAFDIRETGYHVEADVAAFFDHRRYRENGRYEEGVELRTDGANRRIINWPEQHYASGVSKNSDTGRRFKAIVRILKALSVEMKEAGTKTGDIPGFLIECMVWNVPTGRFGNSTYTADVKAALYYLYENTKTDELCKTWVEVSELKYLFHPSQKWTREQANAFTIAAWNHAGLQD